MFSDIASASTYLREDITEGKSGVPLQMLLTIVNVNASCAPITDALVYAWHCDKDGVYSGYSQPGSNTVGETFCRGVQMTDSTGLVRFTTIYPGWYSGRITHAHFRVYLGSSTAGDLATGVPAGRYAIGLQQHAIRGARSEHFRRPASAQTTCSRMASSISSARSRRMHRPAVTTRR